MDSQPTNYPPHKKTNKSKNKMKQEHALHRFKDQTTKKQKDAQRTKPLKNMSNDLKNYRKMINLKKCD